MTLLEEQYISNEEYNEGRNKIDHAVKLLNGYIHYLQKQKDTPPIINSITQ